MSMKNRIKGYIISVILILLLIATAVMGYKKGYLNDVFRKDTQNIISKGSKEKTTVKTEPVYKDEVALLNKGDSYILEYDSEKITGKSVPTLDFKYNIEYVDSYITRELPSEMSIDYYKQEEKTELDSDNNFTSGYHYVVVEINMTNMLQKTCDLAPQSMRIGNFIDNVYKTIGEPRGRISEGMSDKGGIRVEYQQERNIKLCYVAADEYIDDNLVVKCEIEDRNKYKGEVTYLVIGSEE